MEEFIPVLLSAVVSLIITAIGFAKSWIENKRMKERLDNIVDVLHNEEERYYVKCPTCDRKILLAEVQIYAEKKEKSA